MTRYINLNDPANAHLLDLTIAQVAQMTSDNVVFEHCTWVVTNMPAAYSPSLTLVPRKIGGPRPRRYGPAPRGRFEKAPRRL